MEAQCLHLLPRLHIKVNGKLHVSAVFAFWERACSNHFKRSDESQNRSGRRPKEKYLRTLRGIELRGSACSLLLYRLSYLVPTCCMLYDVKSISVENTSFPYNPVGEK
jgi:hypothetical protein